MKMIVFSGLPGTGKSTLAETLGREYGIPVFAKDWLEASMLRSGVQPKTADRSLGVAGYDLLTTLADRQLMLDQSVILDSVASTRTIRKTWHDLANQYTAQWRVIECICSNESLHREKLKNRTRNIPGWHELKWSDIQKVKQYYQAWDEERLVLDMVDDISQNISRVKSYCE